MVPGFDLLQEIRVPLGLADLIPTEAGAYALVCEIEGHFEAGMSGTITVAPAT